MLSAADRVLVVEALERLVRVLGGQLAREKSPSRASQAKLRRVMDLLERTRFGQCQYPDCDQAATDMAKGTEHALGQYCPLHAGLVAAEGDPQYLTTCPHCQCRFGDWG